MTNNLQYTSMLHVQTLDLTNTRPQNYPGCSCKTASI
uniref:Uncharacterized protein n=1 Tax=Arundo donax TaxID=35708 RepID=A0A0A9ATW5_ARUDO